MTKPTTYYVTTDGLAAALSSPDILSTMRGILQGRAHPMTIKSFVKRNYIAKDMRAGTRADHNTLILSGAVERVREVLINAPAPPPATSANGHGKKAVTYALKSSPEPQFSPTVEKVKHAMSTLEGEVTFSQIADHPELRGMNPGTLRWAIQMLRRAGVCESKAA